MKNAKWKVALCAAWGLLAIACDDPLKEVDVIEETRVLGARVEVEGEPERASPAPGETATVRWFVVAPDVEPELSFRLVVCEATSGDSGVPECAKEPFAEASRDEPRRGAPSITFEVPKATRSSSLAVKGVICEGVNLEACNGDVGTEVSFDFSLIGVGDENETPNENPTLGALKFDGEPWSEGTDCAKLPRVEPKSEHEITIELDEDDRDPVIPEFDVEPDRETLQLSHFTDHGSFSSAFTVIEPSSTELVRRVQWLAPSRAPERGVARVFVVLRDSRGGTDWVTRAVCF